MKRYGIVIAFVALLVGMIVGSLTVDSQKLTASDPAELPLAKFEYTEPCDRCECPTIDVSTFATKDELADLRADLLAEIDKRIPKPVVIASPAPVKAAPVVSSSYQARWQNYDGKNKLQHAIEDHGIDVSKYSTDDVLKMMDADHDRFGGSAHAAIKASRTSTVTRARSTVSSCPGGVCPTPQSYSRPAFRLFRR